jgi:hypothetical protein
MINIKELPREKIAIKIIQIKLLKKKLKKDEIIKYKINF